MIRCHHFATLAAALLAAAPATEPAPPDLLRLTNGELEGRFGGLSPDGILLWERDDTIEPMEFRTDKVRQVILRGGPALKARNGISHVELINGDRIPATITSLDEASLTIESDVAGLFVIPRDAIRRIAPNPFGGRLIYAGPFDPEAWNIDDGRDPETATGENDQGDETVEADAAEPEEEAEAASAEEEAPAPGWQHLGSRWYHHSGNEAITLNAGMPRRSIFRFRLEWRGRSSISAAFHADFAPLPPVEEEEEAGEGKAKPPRRIIQGSSSSLTNYFGRSLVMTLRGNYVMLYQCGYNKDGAPFARSLRSSNRTLNFDESGDADFEFRSDLDKGFISLYVNGEFSMQWQIEPGDGEDGANPLPGAGIGFRVDGSDTPMRVSDVIVAEWNGMPDAARSLENEDRDIVLLTNGTDRVSGKVTTITDGNLHLEGPYAPLVIPAADIAEIRFATASRREAPLSSEGHVRIHFQPIGRITGTPGTARDGRIAIKSLLLGDLSVALESASILEFRQGGSFLDPWDDDF